MDKGFRVKKYRARPQGLPLRTDAPSKPLASSNRTREVKQGLPALDIEPTAMIEGQRAHRAIVVLVFSPWHAEGTVPHLIM